MKNDEQKRNCIDDLSASLRRTATWRRRLQAKYINDARNGRAADILDMLASETDQLSDGAWLELQKYYDWRSGKWADALSIASRHVEFQRNVRTFTDFVNNLIRVLEEQNSINSAAN